MASEDIINLNLRGVIFRTKTSKLKSFSDSRLANLSPTNAEYDHERNEYFFDRNPLLFHYILDAYDYGNLHFPKSVCSNIIDRELKFWKMGRSTVGKCCINTCYADDGIVEKYEEIEEMGQLYYLDDDAMRKLSKRKRKILLTMTRPMESTFGKVGTHLQLVH